MRFFIRIFKRILIFICALGVAWFLVTQIYSRFDEQIKIFFVAIFLYIIVAYTFLPELVRIFLKISKKKYIPSMTKAWDGLSADPVNIVLYGTRHQLISAFEKIGWHQADGKTIHTSLKMIRSFILNKSYPEAPFSSLYLFGRRQDIGFQEPIGNSPRKRHHVRFWCFDSDIADNKMIWIGAATKDIGFGFARLTYQISHKIDFHVDEERTYIIDKLTEIDLIENIQEIQPQQEFCTRKYISDGSIVAAHLTGE